MVSYLVLGSPQIPSLSPIRSRKSILTQHPSVTLLCNLILGDCDTACLLDSANGSIPGWEPLEPTEPTLLPSPVPDVTGWLNSQPLREG